MAKDQRPTDLAVAEQLSRQPQRFEFFQAVRLLEWLLAAGPQARWNGLPPGASALRFRADVSRALPASDVVAVDDLARAMAASGRAGAELGRPHPATMTVSFLGLAAPGGPLPDPYVDMVLREIRDWPLHRTAAQRADVQPLEGPPLRDFLGIFDHRLIGLLYRAHHRRRVALAVDPPEHSHLARQLGRLLGSAAEPRPGTPLTRPAMLLRYAGLLGPQGRSMAALEALLADALGHPVRGHQWVGRWVALQPGQRSRIGASARRAENNVLGRNVVLGRRAWDPAGRLDLSIGPLTAERLEQIVAGDGTLPRVQQLCSHFLRDELHLGLRLLVPQPARLVLSSRPARGAPAAAGAATAPLRLGHSFLKTREPRAPREQPQPVVVVLPSEGEAQRAGRRYAQAPGSMPEGMLKEPR